MDIVAILTITTILAVGGLWIAVRPTKPRGDPQEVRDE